MIFFYSYDKGDRDANQAGVLLLNIWAFDSLNEFSELFVAGVVFLTSSES